MVAQCCQLVNQFSFPGQGDVVLLLGQGGVVQFPVCLVLLVRFLFPPGQRELERGVDAFQGLIQVAHVDHAIVVLAQNLIDAIAEMVNQNGPGSAERDQQGKQRNHCHNDSAAKSHGYFPPIIVTLSCWQTQRTE